MESQNQWWEPTTIGWNECCCCSSKSKTCEPVSGGIYLMLVVVVGKWGKGDCHWMFIDNRKQVVTIKAFTYCCCCLRRSLKGLCGRLLWMPPLFAGAIQMPPVLKSHLYVPLSLDLLPIFVMYQSWNGQQINAWQTTKCFICVRPTTNITVSVSEPSCLIFW